MITANHAIRPVKQALLACGFGAWLELGNAEPADWSGADALAAACFRSVLGGGAGESIPREVRDGAEAGDLCCMEICAYSDTISLLSGVGDAEKAVTQLCKLSFIGCGRAQRVLSGAGYVLFGEVPHVPRLDGGRAGVAASGYLLETGDFAAAARVLFAGGWGVPEAYFSAARILLSHDFEEEAIVSLKMGDGLGDISCAGHLAALFPRAGDSFKLVQKAAERGLAIPLVAAGIALENGEGVDQDVWLAGAYFSLADRIGGQGGFEKWFHERRERVGPRKKAMSKHLFEMAASWGGKHPDDPIFYEAAKLWKELQRA